METYQIQSPISAKEIDKLMAGDIVYLNGIIYTARDAAHKKLIELIVEDKDLPFDIDGQSIYYVGPCPAKEGEIIGSAGPTTSGRMDAYTVELLEKGLKCMIGKGERDKKVIDAMITHKAVYLAAIGGAGALIKNAIISSEIVAFEELGTEAIRKLEVKNMPLIVAVDSKGKSLYK